MKNETNTPVFRQDALSMKEFYRLSTKEKDEYILFLFSLPVENRADVDKHILKFHSVEIKEKENFYSLEE